MVHPGLRVGDLTELIDHQEVLLPDFQRGYVWRRSQALKFLDSLYRGYPVGQVLLWIPRARLDEGGFPLAGRPVGQPPPGPDGRTDLATSAATRTAPPQFVLDGQQRLTTLYRMLRSQEGSRYRFHAADEVFQAETAVHTKDPLWVSVSEVVGSERGLAKALGRLQKELGWTPDDPRFEALQANLQRLAMIRERVLPVDVVRIGEPEQVAELFVRINSGTPLRRAELALAQLAWRWPGAMMGRLGDAVEEFAEIGFDFPAPFLMRDFVSVATGQSGFSNLEPLWKLTDLSLAKNWEKTHKGLQSAVEFVREVARVTNGEDLPSLNVLIPITALFARGIRLDEGQTHQLYYWFLVASAFGRYGANVEARLNEDLRALYTEAPMRALLSTLDKFTPAPARVAPGDLEGKGVGSNAFVLMASLLRVRGIKDWFPASAGGRAPSPARGEVDLVLQPVFTRRQLQDAGQDPELADEMANLLILPHRPPVRFAGSPEEMLSRASSALLKDQWVPEDRTSWEAAHATVFLEARRVRMARAFSFALEQVHSGNPPAMEPSRS